jgi:hypothetical protein
VSQKLCKGTSVPEGTGATALVAYMHATPACVSKCRTPKSPQLHTLSSYVAAHSPLTECVEGMCHMLSYLYTYSPDPAGLRQIDNNPTCIWHTQEERKKVLRRQTSSKLPTRPSRQARACPYFTHHHKG